MTLQFYCTQQFIYYQLIWIKAPNCLIYLSTYLSKLIWHGDTSYYTYLNSSLVSEMYQHLLQCSVKYFQAFAWFSDLLVEHSEIFWSLFGVDMDTVLSEQPPDT